MTSSSTGSVRRLWPSDRDTFRAHLLRLDAETRRSRFGSSVSDAFLEQHAARTLQSRAIIFGHFNGGMLRATAELHPFRHDHVEAAEAAFSVERDWQNGGIGSSLLGRVLLAARNRNIRQLHVTCMTGNRRMQKIAAKYNAELKFRPDEVMGELRAAHRTPLSLYREAFSEMYGFGSAFLDVQSQFLRPLGHRG